MAETLYRDRRAVQIENQAVRVTLLVEGGHIAEILHKQTGVNPLWTPPWPSIEPSAYRRDQHPGYGSDAESKLLAGIMGHNLCLDTFGPPSDEEAAAGITAHGEASVQPYSIRSDGPTLVASTRLPAAQLHFERRIELVKDTVRIKESVENLSRTDRPIAWTQHVTLGPPFLERGLTQLRAPGTRSKTYEAPFGDRYIPGKEFDWPYAPGQDGSRIDVRTYTSARSSAGFTTHLMDPHRDEAFFLAWSPANNLLFGYRWPRREFPWLGMWEENHSRSAPPWNGKTLTLGMEFGASPMPETRKAMIERGRLFGVPTYRWLPARSTATVEYSALIQTADAIPDEL